MDCRVHGIAKSRTRLSDFHFHFNPTVARLMMYKLQVNIMLTDKLCFSYMRLSVLSAIIASSVTREKLKPYLSSHQLRGYVYLISIQQRARNFSTFKTSLSMNYFPYILLVTLSSFSFKISFLKIFQKTYNFRHKSLKKGHFRNRSYENGSFQAATASNDSPFETAGVRFSRVLMPETHLHSN